MTATLLPIDAGAVQQQATSNANATTSTFDSVLNTSQYATGVFSPFVTTSLASANVSDQAQSIVSVALNATNPVASASYLSTGSSATGATNYLTGGTNSSFLTTGGSNMYSSSTSSSTDIDSLISESSMQQGYLIAVQIQMQNQSLTTNMVSTALKDKHDAEMGVANKWG